MDILNLSAPGAYSKTLSPRIKNRNEEAIGDMVTDAGLMILRTLGEFPNEYRQTLVVPVGLTHQELVPEHQGKPAYVEIRRYPGAQWTPGHRIDYRKVESYRNDPNRIYDPIAHDTLGSSVAGYYDLWEGRFYFTGYQAQAGFVQILRADTATKIPDVLEATWIRLAVGESDKAGQGQYGSSVAGQYGQKGMADLAEFRSGQRRFTEVSEPEPTGAAHE